jgi:hypothetical protein
MGSYATRQDIVDLLHDRFDLTPYEDKANDRILEREAEIEGKLAKFYTVPITGTKSLRVIKSIVADLATSDLIFEVRQLEEQEQVYANLLLGRAMAKLTDLLEGNTELTDANEVASDEVTGTDGYEDLTSSEQLALVPVFTRSQMYDDQDPW